MIHARVEGSSKFGGESERIHCKTELVRITSQISVGIDPHYLTAGIACVAMLQLFPCISSGRRQTWDAAVGEICWVWGGEGGLPRLGEAGTGPSPPWWDYQGTKALTTRSSVSQHFTEMAEWGWSTASDLGHPVGLSGEHSQWHTRRVPEKEAGPCGHYKGAAEYVYMYMHYIQNRHDQLNVQSQTDEGLLFGDENNSETSNKKYYLKWNYCIVGKHEAWRFTLN